MCVVVSLYMKAAQQGYAIAQSNVAVEYSTGTGAVPQNLAAGVCSAEQCSAEQQMSRSADEQMSSDSTCVCCLDNWRNCCDIYSCEMLT